MDTLPEQNGLSIVSNFKAGNESAFDVIFNHLYSPLCVFTQGIINDHFAAEDITQEAFVKLWEKHADFDNFPSIRSFLYITVKNAAFNFLEKGKVKQKHQNYVLKQDLSVERSILHGIIEAEVLHNIVSTIETLPEQCQRIIKMTFLEGLKPKDISAKLGISVSTVNNQKMRGLSLLKERLTQRDFLFCAAVIIHGFWK